MRLLLFHPGAASIDCAECQKWAFNIETGEKQTFKSGPTRELLPMALGPNDAPPCHKCPKGSPEKAKELELSEKNWAAFAHYEESKVAGLSEEERRDPIIRRNMALIERIVSEKRNGDQARNLAEALIAVLTSGKAK